MQPVSCVLFEVSDGGGPGICSLCKGSSQQWATRPPRASLGLPCMAWGMGTAELPRPQLWASRQLPPLRKGLRAEGPWAALPRTVTRHEDGQANACLSGHCADRPTLRVPAWG